MAFIISKRASYKILQWSRACNDCNDDYYSFKLRWLRKVEFPFIFFYVYEMTLNFTTLHCNLIPYSKQY